MGFVTCAHRQHRGPRVFGFVTVVVVCLFVFVSTEGLLDTQSTSLRLKQRGETVHGPGFELETTVSIPSPVP